jgi:hypothetical protein
MDPSLTNAVVTPWASTGIIGSVVVSLGLAVVGLVLFIKSMWTRTVDRLEKELDKKEDAYERLVESTRKLRTKEEPSDG